jgi:hypothetical protein
MSYSWTLRGGTISIATTGASITWTAGAAGSATLSCGESDGTTQSPAGTKQVTVLAAPVTPTISAEAHVAATTAAHTATVTARPGMTYSWANSGGTLTSGTTGASITYSVGAPGTLTLTCVEMNAAGATSAPGNATVIVNPPPTVSATPVISAPASATAGASAYRLQVSADSTNGQDGTWTTVVTVTANPYTYRQHLNPFTGMKWLKLTPDSNVTIAELEVWDASNGVSDT